MEQLTEDRIYQYMYKAIMRLYEAWKDENVELIYPEIDSPN